MYMCVHEWMYELWMRVRMLPMCVSDLADHAWLLANDARPQVAMLASDFADFDINMSTIENPLEEDDDEGDPNDDEAPRDL